MNGLSHIRCVLIGVEYQNCHLTLDVYLLFANLLGQIKVKLDLCESVWIEFAPSKYQKVNKHSKFDDNFGIQRQLEHFEYEMNRTLLKMMSCFFKQNDKYRHFIVFIDKKKQF